MNIPAEILASRRQARLTIINSLIFIAFGVIVLNLVLAGVDIDRTIKTSANSSIIILLVFAAQEVLFLVPIIYYAFRLQLAPSDLGFKTPEIARSIKYILGGHAVFTGINFLIAFAGDKYGINIPGYGEQSLHLPIFGADEYSTTIAILVLVVFAPFVEEVFFRGLLYNKFKTLIGTNAGIFMTAVVFALFHMEPEVIIPLFIVGFIMTYMYEKLGSIWPVILFHVLNNAVALIAEYYLIT